MTHDNGGSAFPSLRENNNPAMPLVSGAEGMTLHDYFMAHAPEKPNWFSVERDNPVEIDYSKMPKDYHKKLGAYIEQCKKDDKNKSPRLYFEKDPPEYLAWYDLEVKYSRQRLDMDTEHQIKTMARWRSFYATAMIAEKRRIEKEEK